MLHRQPPGQHLLLRLIHESMCISLMCRQEALHVVDLRWITLSVSDHLIYPLFIYPAEQVRTTISRHINGGSTVAVVAPLMSVPAGEEAFPTMLLLSMRRRAHQLIRSLTGQRLFADIAVSLDTLLRHPRTRSRTLALRVHEPESTDPFGLQSLRFVYFHPSHPSHHPCRKGLRARPIALRCGRTMRGGGACHLGTLAFAKK